jgi:hypothetical protein
MHQLARVSTLWKTSAHARRWDHRGDGRMDPSGPTPLPPSRGRSLPGTRRDNIDSAASFRHGGRMPSDRDQDPAAGRLRGCQCPGRDFKRSMRLSLPAARSISKGPLQLENLWLRMAPGQPGCFPIPQSCWACGETVCAGINIPEIRHDVCLIR